MREKKLLMISLISFSLLLLSCKGEKPDAYLCDLRISAKDVSKSYLYCKNVKTKKEINVLIGNADKYICADPASFNTFYNYSQANCK